MFGLRLGTQQHNDGNERGAAEGAEREDLFGLHCVAREEEICGGPGRSVSPGLRGILTYSCRIAGVPLETACAKAAASQLVMRMQPWDCVLPTFDGSGVPWMP
jgi:hypothetical protein